MRLLNWLTPIFTGGALAAFAACASASEPTLQCASTGVTVPVPTSVEWRLHRVARFIDQVERLLP